MQNFAIRLEIERAIIVSKHRIMLDAILASIHYQMNEDRNAAIEELPLAKSDTGIVMGSQMFYEMDDPTDKYTVGYSSSVQRTLQNYEITHLVPRFVTDGGNSRHPVLRNTDDMKIVASPTAVWFFGQGDLQGVVKQLRHLHHVGPKRTSGFGRIKSMEILSVENKENGIYDPDGVVMRPVPLSKWKTKASKKGIDILDDNWEPPYHLPGSRVVCVVPRNAFLSTEKLNSFLGNDSEQLHYQEV